MYDLFNPPPDNSDLSANSNSISDISKISGLSYIPNFISDEEEENLVKSINSFPWLSDIKRRVQHYGYKYDYKARSINYEMYLGPLPSWAATLANRLFDKNYVSELPDQVIVNEYVPGQGITNHVDCEPCFGESIASISLLSPCIMDIINLKSKQKIELLLERKSIIILTGEARHNWSHGIAQRKSDVYNNMKFDRRLRISMTFRKVVLK